MSAINVLLAVLGSGITLMVVVGIAFLTPHGTEAHMETPDLHSQPSPPTVEPSAKNGSGQMAVASASEPTDAATRPGRPR